MELPLRVAYGLNVLILAPVVPMVLTGGDFADGRLGRTPDVEKLVGSVWLAILVCSVIGLAYPRLMIGILPLQIIYKATWLALVVWPLYRAGGGDAVPWGVTGAFLVVLAFHPVALWFALAAR